MLDLSDFKMKQIVIASLDYGDKLSFQNDNIVIKDKDNKIKIQATCYRIFALFIIGNASITTPLIQKAKKFGFNIILFTKTFRLYEVIGCSKDSNTLLHLRQYYYDKLDIAKYIIKNKINNQLLILKNERNKTDEIKEGILKIRRCYDSIDDCDNINSIMGYEGIASKIYFNRIFSQYDWKRRIPRIKPDYINSLLDVGYTVLFSFVESILCIYGFDVYYGVLHTLFYMRKSLVCDLMEPMRPIIDIQIRKSINLSQFREEDFIYEDYKYILKWEKTSQYISIFLKAILERKEDIFLFIQKYYRSFMKGKDIKEYPIFEV